MKLTVQLYRKPVDKFSRPGDPYTLVARVNGGQEILFRWDLRALRSYANGLEQGVFHATQQWGDVEFEPSHEVAFWMSGEEIRLGN